MTDKKSIVDKCLKLGMKVKTSMSKEKLLRKLQDYELNASSKIIIKDNRKNIVKFIYHLADIHIRYIDRHEEYRQVFEKLYDKISTSSDNCNESVMVICGDIFHNRDRFVSETIIIFDEFLKKVSGFIPIFIILGNHDCFNHKDRLDTLSGIMKIKDYSNVHFLKNSGVYEYKNLVFGVSSILDGMITPCPIVEENKTTVALYHGIVSGCILDNDYTSNGLSIDVFDNYDITLLGDVHKRQFLDKKKSIAYPGSLIQQNFKEEIDHGFLLWNVEQKSSEFVKLHNDYSYLDIPLEYDTDLQTYPFSKFSRIRIIINPQDLDSDIKKFTEEIKKFTEIISLKTIMRDTLLTKISNDDPLVNNKEIDISSKETNIIKDLLKDNENYLEDILNIHNKLEKEVEDVDMNFKNSIPWNITEIEFMNIFCYGNDILNKIKFKEGITGILASNASGKTNILNTILYGLFGNIYTRNQNQNNRNIISRFADKKGMYVKLSVITSNNEVYYIERTAKNRNRTKGNGNEQLLLSETLDFYSDSKKLNMSTKVETEKFLRETLSFSSKDDFILTNMISNISYGSNISILSMNGSQLDEVFNNMFNLNKYKLLHNNIKSMSKKVSEDIKSLYGKIDVFDAQNSKIDIKISESRYKKITSELNKNKKDLEKFISNLADIDENLMLLKQIDISKDKETIKNIIEENESEIKLFTDDFESILYEKDFFETEYSRLLKEYKDEGYQNYISIPEIPNLKIRNLTDILQDISFYEGKKQKIDFTNDITNEYMEARKMLKICEECDTVNTEDIKKIISNLKYSEKLKCYMLRKEQRDSIINDLDKKYIDPSTILKYKQIIQDKENRDKCINDNIINQQKINSLKIELKNNKINYAHQLKKKVNYYNECLNVIELYYENLDLQKDLKVLEENKQFEKFISEKNNLTSDIKKLQESIIKNSNELTKLDIIIENYYNNCKNKEEFMSEIKKKEELYKMYKLYTDITHSKNLPKMLISNIVKNICNEANSLIFNSTGLLCEIQENEKWEIVVKKNNTFIGPEHCSGYERFIINTSLKIAFDKYKQMSSIKLFLIDEVIDCVSEDNFDQIDNVLSYLKNHYNSVLLISHNEELKKKVDNRIEIDVKGSYSCIV